MASENGIAITVKGFIPIDPHDLEKHRDAIDAVVEAKTGKLETLASVGFRVEEFKADPVKRRGREAPAE
ncbi:hypothetical protein [Pararhizobium haloflavum]|uniref:hypothetical protein n=1 Tax=Pararhizobium haloflavum TaxID=2037914 RepID=UPI000C17539B|nr:hypothetical protein [Pararhizobium haloflavum]